MSVPLESLLTLFIIVHYIIFLYSLRSSTSCGTAYVLIILHPLWDLFKSAIMYKVQDNGDFYMDTYGWPPFGHESIGHEPLTALEQWKASKHRLWCPIEPCPNEGHPILIVHCSNFYILLLYFN